MSARTLNPDCRACTWSVGCPSCKNKVERNPRKFWQCNECVTLGPPKRMTFGRWDRCIFCNGEHHRYVACGPPGDTGAGRGPFHEAF